MWANSVQIELFSQLAHRFYARRCWLRRWMCYLFLILLLPTPNSKPKTLDGPISYGMLAFRAHLAPSRLIGVLQVILSLASLGLCPFRYNYHRPYFVLIRQFGFQGAAYCEHPYIALLKTVDLDDLPSKRWCSGQVSISCYSAFFPNLFDRG